MPWKVKDKNPQVQLYSNKKKFDKWLFVLPVTKSLMQSCVSIIVGIMKAWDDLEWKFGSSLSENYVIVSIPPS